MLSLRAPAWAWVLVAAAVAGFVRLGVWQTSKGLQKAELVAAHESAAAQAPLPLAQAQAPSAQQQAVWVMGEYDPRSLLLDGQSYQQKPGVQVWSPLKLRDGGWLMVNRGWVPMEARANLPPPPSGWQRVSGLLRDLPRPALATGGNCAGEGWPRLVQYPTATELGCLYAVVMPDALLLLAPDAEGGFVRDWQPAAQFPPSRHYGYAFTWFSLALTALVLFVLLNRKKS